MDVPFRDDENEDRMQQIIYASARREDVGGEDSGGEDSSGEDDFSTQFLNDSGEGLESEERRDDKVPSCNSDLHVSVDLHVLLNLYVLYICINVIFV